MRGHWARDLFAHYTPLTLTGTKATRGKGKKCVNLNKKKPNLSRPQEDSGSDSDDSDA